MTLLLPAGAVVHAADVALEHAAVSPMQVVDGAPTVGVWECTAVSSTDVEVDEVSVVISGRARIDFVSPALPSIEVGPGDVFRLESGMKTVWTVKETLRKIYVT